jgi:hypothetical protein
MSYEAMLSVGERAYELATGRRIAPGSELPHIPGRASWPADRIADYEWTDDTVAALFPALAERWPR